MIRIPCREEDNIFLCTGDAVEQKITLHAAAHMLRSGTIIDDAIKNYVLKKKIQLLLKMCFQGPYTSPDLDDE